MKLYVFLNKKIIVYFTIKQEKIHCFYEQINCLAAHASLHSGFVWIAFWTNFLLLTGLMQRIASLAKTSSLATSIDDISLKNQRKTKSYFIPPLSLDIHSVAKYRFECLRCMIIVPSTIRLAAVECFSVLSILFNR